MVDFSKISNGSIVRLKSDNDRDRVCIHYTHYKNHTGYYLFGGLWYDGDALTCEPYGKCIERLERGMFPDIEIVGHIKDCYENYKKNGRIGKDM